MQRLSHWNAGGVRSTLIFAVFLYLPLSMPWVVLLMYITRTRWSCTAILERPETWMLFALGVLAWRAGVTRRARQRLREDPNLRWLFLLAGLFVGWSSICAVVQGAYTPYWVPYLVAGWVLPIGFALILLGLGETALDSAWRGLRLGVVLLLLLTLALYFASFGFHVSLRDILFNRYVRAQAGMGGGVYVSRLTLGDYNSVAVFFAAVAAFCLGRRPARARGARWLAWSVLAAALVLVYLTYSRGAMVSVAAAALAVVVLAVVRPKLGSGRLIPRSLVVLLLFGLVVTQKDARSHWSVQTVGVKGSGKVRLEMWRALVAGRADADVMRNTAPAGDTAKQDVSITEAVDGRPAQFSVSLKLPFLGSRDRGSARRPLSADEARQAAARFRSQVAARVGSALRRYVFGVGLGNFGVLDGMSFDTGTHSLFLDAFAASGLAGIAIFAAFWFALGWRLWNGVRTSDRASAAFRAAPEPLASFLAFLAVSISGVIVNFRLDGLGILLPAGALWLMVISVPRRPEETREQQSSEVVV